LLQHHAANKKPMQTQSFRHLIKTFKKLEQHQIQHRGSCGLLKTYPSRLLKWKYFKVQLQWHLIIMVTSYRLW